MLFFSEYNSVFRHTHRIAIILPMRHLPRKYANFTAKIPVCLHYENPF